MIPLVIQTLYNIITCCYNILRGQMKMASKIYENCYFFVIGCSRPIMSLFVIYIAYLLIGSLLFVKLETTYEQQEINQSIETTNLVKAMVNALRKNNIPDEEIFWTFSQEQYERSTEKIDDLSWFQQYANKLFFAFVLISTIGYGNVLPHSSVGKIACIIYTFFGLALHVIMMRLLSFKFRGGLRKVLRVTENFYGSNGFLLFVAGILFFLFWAGVFMFFPGYVFTLTEEWRYHLGAYFSFVSLSTIGLGDFVAGVSSKHLEEPNFPLNAVCMLIWLFFGLGFFSMAFNLFSYLLGRNLLAKLDCHCKKRSVAKKKMEVLLELIIELNWQLVKYKPDNFHQEDEIENFKILLSEKPHDVNNEMIYKIFDVVSELRDCTYDQLSGLITSDFPDSPFLRQAKENFPDTVYLSAESVPEPEPQKHDPEDPVGITPTATRSLFEFVSGQESERTETLPLSRSFSLVSQPRVDIQSSKSDERPPIGRDSPKENMKQIGTDKNDGSANQTADAEEDKTPSVKDINDKNL